MTRSSRNSKFSKRSSEKSKFSGKGRRSSGSGRSSKGGSDSPDYIMVGSVTLSKKAGDNEEEILDTMAEAIEEGLPLQKVLQVSGLQLWMQFWWPEEGSMTFERKDRVLITFKEPHEKAPDFNLATASFDKNS